MATSQLFGDSRDPAADCLDASVDHCIVPAFTSPSLSECMGSELGGSTSLAVENHPVQCVPLVDNGPMQPSTAPGPDDGVSPRQSSCVVESQAHAEWQQHVSPCQSSRVVVSQAHAEPREHARRLPSHRAWPCLSQTMQTSTCRVRAATAHQVVQIQLDCKHRMSRGRCASSSRPFARLFQQQCQRLQPRVAGRSRVCLTQKMAFRAVVLGCQRRATACQQARGAGIERPHSQMAGNGGRHVSGC
jgi:hypothetical protein